MLISWIPKNEPNSIPDYATHTVGVGGFIVRENEGKKEALVVKEKKGMITDIWKFPGGMKEPGIYIYPIITTK